MIGPLLLLAMMPQSAAAESLMTMARRLPESALVLEVRTRPLAVREAVTDAMERAVRVPADSGDVLRLARRLSAAYATAWRDSFYVRQIDRFAAWPPARRTAKVEADRMRRAGVVSYGRDGPAAALPVWRRALVRARGAGDTAGMAAVLGNIGASHLEEGRLDSAEASLTRARRLASLVGDSRVEANAIGLLASVQQERGALDAARAAYAQAAALRARIGDTRGMAADHNNLGLLAQSLGDLEEARRQFESALAINRNEGRDAVAADNLINLAGLAMLEGDFAVAHRQLRDALAVLREREQWPAVAAALSGLGQLELRRADYPAATASLRESARIYDRTGPLAEALTVRRLLAMVLAAAGNLQGAVDELRGAQALADSAGAAVAARAGLALARADLAVLLNTLEEADRRYAEAGRLYRAAGDMSGAAEAAHGRAMLMLERDDPERAQALLLTVLRTHLGAGNRRSAALTRLALAQAARARNDSAAARRHLSRAEHELERLRDPAAVAAVLAEQAAMEAEAGRAAAAESLYLAGLARLEGRTVPDVAWRLRYGLALALRHQNRLDDAARELRAAVAIAERPRRTLLRPERRAAFASDKPDLYGQLALTELRRGLAGAGFAASEQLRAREMLELMSLGRIVPAPDHAAAGLVAREQDLRRRIAELMHGLEEDAPSLAVVRGPDVSRTVGATRLALSRAQDAYAEVLLEMRERAPARAAVMDAPPASWRAVARRLSAGEVFVEYLLSDSGSVAFAITPDTIAALNLGIGWRELARLVELVRGTLAQAPPPGDSLWRSPLRRLHRTLVGPLEEAGMLARAHRLIIAPHAELHYLPFAALLDEASGGFLVQRFELVTTPSATVWLALGDRLRHTRPRGVVALAPRGDVLPASLGEVAAIARRTGALMLTGQQASEAAFRTAAPSHRVLHLATYGVLNKQNPLFSFVDLAPGGGHDGRLEVHEVLGMSLTAELVVLSACQTGVGAGMLADVPPGDDWVGLTRAFLQAGAANVVATLWPVDDQATAGLMERFYEMEGAATAAAALAAAQRAVLAESATTHPFFWAAFVTVGGAPEQGGGSGR